MLHLIHYFTELEDKLSVDCDTGDRCVIGSELHLDVSYLHYLYEARNGISSCMRACRIWSAPYDGRNPPPEEKTQRRVTSQTITDIATSSGIELEWDDSFDAGSTRPTQEEQEETADPVPIQSEPPRHIQELRKTATQLVKGSYIEESEFQNDVMVYDLVAQKDAHDNALQNQTESNHINDEAGVIGSSSIQDPEQDLDCLDENVEIKTRPRSSSQQNLESCKENNGIQSQADPSSDFSTENEDLLTEYDELIRNLVVEVKSPTKLQKDYRNSAVEEGDDVDFNSFSVETPESEKCGSPFRNKPCNGSKSHHIPFTGKIY